MPVSYIMPITKSACVSHCIVTNYMDWDAPNIILAKQSMLEIYALTTNGLIRRDVVRLASCVKKFIAFRPYLEAPSSTLSYLMLCLDTGMAQVLRFHSGRHLLYSAALGKRKMVDQYPYNDILIKNSNESMILWQHTHDQVTAFMLPGKQKPSPDLSQESTHVGSLSDIFSRVTTIQLHYHLRPSDMVFLPNSPMLAVVNARTVENFQLEIHMIDSYKAPKEFLLKSQRSEFVALSARVVAVGTPYSGILVLTDREIYFYKAHKTASKLEYPKQVRPADATTACAEVDTGRFLVTLSNGALYVLSLLGPQAPDGPSNEMELVQIGRLHDNSDIIPLIPGYFVITSQTGPTTVYKIDYMKKSLQPLQEVGGLAQTISLRAGHDPTTNSVWFLASSGRGNKSLIKRLSNSILLEDSFEVEGMRDVTKLWPFVDEHGEKYVVVSYIKQSEIFRLNSVGRRTEIEGEKELDELFDSDHETLAFGTIFHNQVALPVQVTPQQVNVLGNGSWNPAEEGIGSGITLASVSNNYIVACVDGGCIYLLGHALGVIASTQFDSTVSAVSYCNGIVAVSFWQDSRDFALFQVLAGELRQVESVTLSSGLDQSQPKLIRSTCMTELDIFVGTADGTICRYNIEKPSAECVLAKRAEAWIVGSTPVTLAMSGNRIFSISDYLCIMEINGSTVSLPRRVHLQGDLGPPRSIVSFEDGAFVLALNEGMIIGRMRSLRDIYTENWPQENTIVEFCLLPHDQAFVAFLDLQGRSRVSLMDVNTFKTLDSIILRDQAECTSLLHLKQIDTEEGSIVVGAFNVPDIEGERKYLKAFRIKEGKKIKIVMEHQPSWWSGHLIQGPRPGSFIKSCRATLNQDNYSNDGKYFVTEEDIGLHCSTNCSALTGNGRDEVLAGDMMASVVWGRIDKDDAVAEIKRDTSNIWTTSIGLSDDIILQGEFRGTVNQYRKVESRSHLEWEGTLDLHEGMVSNIVFAEPGKRWNPVVSADFRDVVDVKFYFSTIKGGLYMHGVVKDEYSDLLLALQNNLSYVVEFVKCNDSASKTKRRYYEYYRAGTVSRKESNKVVDGELIAEYLNLSPESRLWCLQGQFKGGVPIAPGDDEVLLLVKALRGLA